MRNRVFIGKKNLMIVIEESQRFSGIYMFDSRYKNINNMSYENLKEYVRRNNIRPITSCVSFSSAVRKMKLLEMVYMDGYENAKELYYDA